MLQRLRNDQATCCASSVIPLRTSQVLLTGVSCSHRLRPIGLPLKAMECDKITLSGLAGNGRYNTVLTGCEFCNCL